MIYDYPEYYEIAFSFRDFKHETKFLLRVIDRFSQVKVDRVLEIACGHAPHAPQIATEGLHYIGLDINRHMLDYAAYKAKDLSPRPVFVEGDMTDFTLAEPVDFAFIMLGSLYINSIEDMHRHFDAVSNALNSGGLYFLDWCIQFNDPHQQGAHNDFSVRKNGITVSSRFDISLIDEKQQMFEEVWTVNVDDHGRRRTFRTTERNKAILPEEFLRFIDERNDFEFINWWRDWDFNQPITHADNIIRPIAIVRKI